MSLVTILKTIYYAGHPPGEVNSTGSTLFVRSMRGVMDGESRFIREPNPSLSAFSRKHANSLYWRTLLFRDQVALHCLSINADAFYRK